MIHLSRDPLSAACAPPVNETPKQRAAREAEEAEARRVSELIDEQLRLENQPKNPSVKVLLLGQEGSGEFHPQVLVSPSLIYTSLSLYVGHVGKSALIKGLSFAPHRPPFCNGRRFYSKSQFHQPF
jgi:hypothetical protein